MTESVTTFLCRLLTVGAVANRSVILPLIIKQLSASALVMEQGPVCGYTHTRKKEY